MIVSKNEYKEHNSLQHRKTKANSIITKHYPDKIPVIIQKSVSCTDDIPLLDKCQFLIPKDTTMNQILMMIRSRMITKINDSTALYLFIEPNIFVCGKQLVSELYETYKDAGDNMLYVFYCSENTFG